MNEREALQVVLVKSFETQAPDNALLFEAERHAATRAALDAVGPQGAPDTFIAARAAAARHTLASRLPRIDWILERQGWHPTWLALAIGSGLLVGITADVFGSGRHLNLLAPPAWLVILWNLGVYLLLIARVSGQGKRGGLPRPAWLGHAASALWNVRFRRLPASTSDAGAQSGALRDFSIAWSRASRPLATTRLVVLLHAASAAVAVALIAGMYLRGLVFDYRVEWGSTFLDTQSVHTLLSWLLAPALWLSGSQLPDIAQMEALRGNSQPGPTAATAAPWIHLYAIMLFIVVVLPRSLLACWNAWQAQRMSEHFPLALDESYYRGLLRTQRGEPTRVCVLPYAQLLAESAQQNLRRILALAFDNSPQIELGATTTLGGEDDLGGLLPGLAHATHVVALFDMTATPEMEHHGAFLSGLSAATRAPVLIVVNESGFASRFREYPQRLTERREAWTVFARTLGKRVAFFDLAAPQLDMYVRTLCSAIDELTTA